MSLHFVLALSHSPVSLVKTPRILCVLVLVLIQRSSASQEQNWRSLLVLNETETNPLDRVSSYVLLPYHTLDQ